MKIINIIFIKLKKHLVFLIKKTYLPQIQVFVSRLILPKLKVEKKTTTQTDVSPNGILILSPFGNLKVYKSEEKKPSRCCCCFFPVHNPEILQGDHHGTLPLSICMCSFLMHYVVSMETVSKIKQVFSFVFVKIVLWLGFEDCN